ncbi:MAG: hypothetical protein ACREVQ_09080 [Burkholderiales bacterium]
MKKLFVPGLILSLAGCATALQDRDRCGSLVDTAWKELDSAKVEGFAGTISFAKATGLLTRAKANQAVEDFAECIDTAGRARFFIAESRKGR